MSNIIIVAEDALGCNTQENGSAENKTWDFPFLPYKNRKKPNK